jgi:hypothetical protein
VSKRQATLGEAVTSITEPNPRESNGSGWKTTAIGALWVVLLMVVGWIATDATTARTKMADQIAESQQRIAILEESQRNLRESLKRIEDGIDELRRTQQQDRRR